MTEAQPTDKLADLERRVETGDFGGDFHLFVQREIYPLLVNEEITSGQFAQLVKRYSELNNPYQTVGK